MEDPAFTLRGSHKLLLPSHLDFKVDTYFPNSALASSQEAHTPGTYDEIIILTTPLCDHVTVTS